MKDIEKDKVRERDRRIKRYLEREQYRVRNMYRKTLNSERYIKKGT